MILLGAIGAIGGLAALRAQSAGVRRRIGFLALESLTSGLAVRAIDGLRTGLRELGHVEGHTIEIVFQSAEGRADRLPELARRLVDGGVDLILAGAGNQPAFAAREVTRSIPIVMVTGIDVVETGLVASLARPGGNLTGMAVPFELGMKQLELLHSLVPSPSRVAMLLRSNPARAAKRAAAQRLIEQTLAMTLEFVDVDRPDDLPEAFARIVAVKPSAMLVEPDLMFYQQRDQIVAFARTVRLPAMYPNRDFVDAGGLVSLSVSLREIGRIVIRQVDRILNGAKPADLPIEQPSTFELVINAKTAGALGLELPRSLVQRADHII